MFTCIVWQVTLCDPIWQVTLHSSEIAFLIKKLYTTFNLASLFTVNDSTVQEISTT